MRASEAYAFLESLPTSKRETLRLIAEYLRETGRRCFTYRSLRAYWDRRRLWRELEWHTVERNIRWLAEEGLLERDLRYRGRRAYTIFCLSRGLREVLEAVGWLRYDGEEGDARGG